MLCQMEEDSRVKYIIKQKKCDKYWPKLGEFLHFDKMIITLKSEEEILPKSIVMREINLNYDNVNRNILQLQIICWPDHDIPSKSIGYNLLEIIISYIDEFRNKNLEGPITIHCR